MPDTVFIRVIDESVGKLCGFPGESACDVAQHKLYVTSVRSEGRNMRTLKKQCIIGLSISSDEAKIKIKLASDGASVNRKIS